MTRVELEHSSHGQNPLVLENRRLRPGHPTEHLSRFWDDEWDLTPAIMEEHGDAVTMRFSGLSEHWRDAMRSYMWTLLNSPDVRPVPGSSLTGRLSVRSIAQTRVALGSLLTSLDAIGVSDLRKLDQDMLDQLAIHIGATCNYDKGSRVLLEVRRLWANRELVPPQLCLPPAMPWNGDRSVDLLSGYGNTEMRTKRIADATLIPLMAWARHFIEDFSDDIISSLEVFAHHTARQTRYRSAELHRTPMLAPSETLHERLVGAINELKSLGLGLPGYQRRKNGPVELNWAHMGRLTGSTGQTVKRSGHQLLAESGLGIDSESYVPVRCQGMLDGELWREVPIAWNNVIEVATLLQTACFLVIGYLSGMRPGEVLSLERGCLQFDAARNLWLVRGKRWKAVRDEANEKAVDGELRQAPWVVHELAARAIQVLSEMHPGNFLFPSRIGPQLPQERRKGKRHRPGSARTTLQMGADIDNFVSWVNEYATRSNRADAVPDDPAGAVNPSRLRRTLAWHIVRRPKGLVAAAIQYGHVATLITQGYAGTFESGFPDDISFETWLERAEHLSEVHDYIESGGRVSGPAATELRDRARESTARFAGRVVPTRRQAKELLQHPSMQVYEGDGIHCVFALATALCIDADDPVATPRPRLCKSQCTNIARTDADIIDVRSLRSRLASDTLAPAIRHERNLRLLDDLDHVLEQHEREDP